MSVTEIVKEIWPYAVVGAIGVYAFLAILSTEYKGIMFIMASGQKSEKKRPSR